MLATQHILLALFWMLYGFLHSLLAADFVKQKMYAAMKSAYKYYRILYSLFAAATLAALVWYNFSITTSVLWKASYILQIVAALMAVIGLYMMAVCIKKYFLELSGVDVFIKKTVTQHLQVSGMHKFIRHPLYAGTLLFIWSIVFWNISLSNLISAICITIYTRIGIYFEEKKLVEQFGDSYSNYAKKIPMLIPKFRL